MRLQASIIILHELNSKGELIKKTPLPITNHNYKRFIIERKKPSNKLEVHYFGGNRALLREMKKDTSLKDVKIYL